MLKLNSANNEHALFADKITEEKITAFFTTSFEFSNELFILIAVV